MWAHYKKTFWITQMTICLVAFAVYLSFYHLLAPAALFFVTMQIGAVLGAAWASRLKRKLGQGTP